MHIVKQRYIEVIYTLWYSVTFFHPDYNIFFLNGQVYAVQIYKMLIFFHFFLQIAVVVPVKVPTSSL
jgi:hypothetical protein